MKFLNYKNIAIIFAGLGFIACEPEFDTPLDEAEVVTQSSGSVDFSNYVAVGNSLTAGFADGALYIDGQQNSLPALLARQMKAAGGGDFNIPFMSDNTGGFSDIPTQGPRLVFDVANGVPVPLEATSTTSITTKLQGSFNNMGIPGAKSFHLFAPSYGNPAGLVTEPATANPYFVRIASSPDVTWIEDVLVQQPTFFSYWLGGNDVLSFATSGGDGSEEITSTEMFTQAVQGGIAQISANGARPGVVANIPDINTIPFFTTVPNNALVLDAETAANLTGFFQAYSGIVTQGTALVLAGGNPAMITPQILQQANAVGSQYAFTFNPGPNRFIIQTQETQTNPRGIRQMTANELLVLTIDQAAIRQQGYGSVAVTDEVRAVLGKLATGGTPTMEEANLVLNAVNPFNDSDVLDNDELTQIAEASATFNTILEQTAAAFNLPLVDVRAILQELQGGIDIGTGVLTSGLGLTSAFSLDGIHLNPRGNAELTNRFIQVINETYGATLQPLVPGNFKTVTVK